MMLIPSKAYKKYETDAMPYLQGIVPEPISYPVTVKCMYYMPTRRKVDLVNLLEATLDVLVKAGVLADDNSNIVMSHDGSRVAYCKENPRTEVYIYETDCADMLSHTMRWIPVSERLPEASGRYLVTRGLNACGAMWSRVYITNYSDLMGLKSERIWWNGNVGKSDFERLDDVTAWMPLPRPWKGEDDE